MSESASSAVVRQRREQIVARLCELFARDHLDADELERLIDQVHQTSTPAELDRLLASLPAAVPAAGSEREPRTRSDSSSSLVVAVMGGTQRRGPWTPARQLYVTAVMGGAVLDFRQARLDPGVTEVYVLALMGGVEIVVAPGTLVESNGVGIMGGFAHAGAGRFPVDTSRPVLRVSGLALMGGVEIRERELADHGAAHPLPGAAPPPPLNP